MGGRSSFNKDRRYKRGEPVTLKHESGAVRNLIVLVDYGLVLAACYADAPTCRQLYDLYKWQVIPAEKPDTTKANEAIIGKKRTKKDKPVVVRYKFNRGDWHKVEIQRHRDKT